MPRTSRRPWRRRWVLRNSRRDVFARLLHDHPRLLPAAVWMAARIRGLVAATTDDARQSPYRCPRRWASASGPGARSHSMTAPTGSSRTGAHQLRPGRLHLLAQGRGAHRLDGHDLLPAAADTGVLHERIGWPSRCTVQAPHRATPQPKLGADQAEAVPDDPKQRRARIDIDTLAFPLTLRLIMVASELREWAQLSCQGGSEVRQERCAGRRMPTRPFRPRARTTTARASLSTQAGSTPGSASSSPARASSPASTNPAAA